MSFAPRSPADIVALIAAHPLAWLVSRDFDATMLPLLAECDAAGRLVSLFGHYARRNPQVAAFERDPAALILFAGAQGYVSPGRCRFAAVLGPLIVLRARFDARP